MYNTRRASGPQELDFGGEPQGSSGSTNLPPMALQTEDFRDRISQVCAAGGKSTEHSLCCPELTLPHSLHAVIVYVLKLKSLVSSAARVGFW